MLCMPPRRSKLLGKRLSRAERLLRRLTAIGAASPTHRLNRRYRAALAREEAQRATLHLKCRSPVTRRNCGESAAWLPHYCPRSPEDTVCRCCAACEAKCAR